MADKKQKEPEAVDEAGRRKGLSGAVLVAVGAVLGGAGVVFAVPPRVVEVKVEKQEARLVDVIHPDVLDFTFNPITKTGRGIASFKLQFVYTVREDLEDTAFGQIRERWLLAQSNLLMILNNRSYEELRSEAGLRMVEHAMIDDLDRTLFQDHAGGQVAKVTRILWKKTLFQ